MDKFIYFVWGKWTWTGRLYIIGCIAALVGILWLVSGIQSCRRDKAKQKDEQNREEILRDKGKIEILEKQEKEVIENEKQTNENARRAESNFNSIIRRDSSEFNGNFNSARRKFCKQFPQDSKCVNYP